jgi:hypothetical protein
MIIGHSLLQLKLEKLAAQIGFMGKLSLDVFITKRRSITIIKIINE